MSISKSGTLLSACALTLACFFCTNQQTLHAQGVRVTPPTANPNPLPKAQYYTHFRDFYQGEYARSIKNYQSLLRTAYRDVDGRFFDSVCYLTMIGECYYHLGNYAKAVDAYETAIGIYISRSLWEPRTQLPRTIAADRAAVTKARVNWYNTKRRSAIGVFPQTFSYVFGRMDNERVLREGGAIQNPQARPVDIRETMRCVALAIHRRTEIKGVTSKIDPTTQKIVSGLTTQKFTSANLVGAWKGIVAAMAYSANEDDAKAASLLKSSLSIAGTYDHPLTPIALLELGKISFRKGKFADAMAYCLEASHSAAVHEQYDLIESAMVWATRAQQMKSTTVIFTPLANTIAWAKRENARFLQASLTVELAHNYAEAGKTAEAMSLLSQARRPMARNDIGRSTVAARMLYVSSLSNFQNGNGKKGLSEFNRFLKAFQGAGSKWLYQLSLANGLASANRINGRKADALFTRLLRNPTQADWVVRPMESMAFVATPHVEPLERWFEIAMSQRKIDKAINIAEVLKQHRFYSQLPLGGRILAFRNVLESPDDLLSDDIKKQRNILLARFGAYKPLSEQSAKLQAELSKLPLNPASGTPESKQQKKVLQSLGKLTVSQEAILGAMALTRLPSDFVFPPLVDFKSAQSELKPRQCVVYCVGTRFNFHVFLIANGSYGHVGPIQPNVFRKGVSTLLKDIGSRDRVAAVPIDVLQSEDWKETAKKIGELVFPKRNADFWKEFKEVVIVPDDAAWYLPWELVQVQDGESTKALNEFVDMRYIPTLGLAVKPNPLPPKYDNVAVVVGKLTAKDTSEKTTAEMNRLKAAIPKAAEIDQNLNGPSSLLSSVFDTLLVWTELKEKPGYRMSPLQIDKGKVGSTLGSWMALPWRGPQHIIMPGFSTSAATALKTRRYGDDLFITSCSLMAAGGRTMLISRWVVGGSTSLKLTREFTSQLPNSSAQEAWKRAVKIVSEDEIDPDSESRVKSGQVAKPIKASHPFFWSGYILIDSGKAEPKEQEKQGAK